MSPYSIDRETLESLCEVTFIKAGGPGGQHRNRRETGVRLHHPPSGLTIEATERRSQTQNLEMAYERLIRKLIQLNKPVKPRRATRPTRASRERRITSKKQISQKKAMRRKPERNQ